MLETNIVVIQSYTCLFSKLQHTIFDVQRVFIRTKQYGLIRVFIFAMEKILQYWYHPGPTIIYVSVL